MTSESSMQEARHPKSVLRDNSEECGREGGGRGFRMGDTFIPVADSC